MTREDIVRMAREAGLPNLRPNEACVADLDELERFAQAAYAAGAAAEREACARLAETCREWDDTGMMIADQIRARGQA